MSAHGRTERVAARAVKVPTPDEVRAWPVTVAVPEGGRCWGLGRDASYDLARTGEFPVPVLRLGSSLRVTRASILTALGIPDTPDAPSTALAPAGPGASALVRGLVQPTDGRASDLRSNARPSVGAA